MCGIAGFVSDAPGEGVLRRMLDAIVHRGPDDSGMHLDGPAAIGMRRLSIIDVASGHQPMCGEDSSRWIVYNGEIFNHADLRPALERAGHLYRTRCDTETILHAFEEHGPACLSLLRGMFAFAVWDNRSGRLFAARDRLGIKPFYYYWDGRLFAFASEIKSLFEHPGISPALEKDALSEALGFGYTNGDRTLFRGIRKLPPGHYLELDTAGPEPRLRIEQWWDPPLPTAYERRAECDWIAECRERLEQTVRMRLMSDVPLGMFLSGGVDSSAIAALMSRMVDGPVKTFAVGYRENEFSELAFARRVAQAIGTDHHEVLIGAADFFGALPGLVWHEDEPIAWPSSVSLYFVSRLASEHVKVVLTGEGSDEMFAGYERYGHQIFNSSWGRRYGFAPEWIRRAVRNALGSTALLPRDLRRKLGHTFFGRDLSLESLYLDNFYCAFGHQELRRLLPGAGSPYAGFLEHWNRGEGAHELARMLYADQKTYLVELLMKQDQMSMACSIESRVPFLDHPFVEFAASVPPEMKLRGGTQKYIFKRAVEDLLPRDIIYRKKMGFPTPLRAWLREPATAHRLFSYLEEKDGLLGACLDPAAVRSLLESHGAGREDATDRIWRLLNLQIWGDLYITGRGSRLETGLLDSRPALTL